MGLIHPPQAPAGMFTALATDVDVLHPGWGERWEIREYMLTGYMPARWARMEGASRRRFKRDLWLLARTHAVVPDLKLLTETQDIDLVPSPYHTPFLLDHTITA